MCIESDIHSHKDQKRSVHQISTTCPAQQILLSKGHTSGHSKCSHHTKYPSPQTDQEVRDRFVCEMCTMNPVAVDEWMTYILVLIWCLQGS